MNYNLPPKFNRAQRRAMKRAAIARGHLDMARDIDKICDGLERHVFQPKWKEQNS